MAHHDFSMPITEAQVRGLRVNDTVTLGGTLFGIRDGTQIHMFDRDRKTRFDLRGHAVIHTAPNVKPVEKSAQHPAGYAPICVASRIPKSVRWSVTVSSTRSARACASVIGRVSSWWAKAVRSRAKWGARSCRLWHA